MDDSTYGCLPKCDAYWWFSLTPRESFFLSSASFADLTRVRSDALESDPHLHGGWPFYPSLIFVTHTTEGTFRLDASLTRVSVPEPSLLVMLGVGMVGLVRSRLR